MLAAVDFPLFFVCVNLLLKSNLYGQKLHPFYLKHHQPIPLISPAHIWLLLAFFLRLQTLRKSLRHLQGRFDPDLYSNFPTRLVPHFRPALNIVSPHARLPLIAAAVRVHSRPYVRRLSAEDQRSRLGAQKHQEAFGDKKLSGKGEKMEERGDVNDVDLAL